MLYAEPFILTPSNPARPNEAVLLIHGLLSTPYLMRSLADFYCKNGFYSQAILLPGHGRKAAALFDVTWQDWHQAVTNAILQLQRDGYRVHLCGFSLGATLALLTSFEHDIQSLTLIAPALGIHPCTRFFSLLGKSHPGRCFPFISTASEKENLGSYTAFPAYAAGQVYLAIKALLARCHGAIHLPPTFVVASGCDRTVNTRKIIQFFNHIQSKKEILCYPSHLGISHVALPVSPTDAYYGQNGAYYAHVPANTRFGEPGFIDTHFRHIKRLTYNPDFSGMITAIAAFISHHLGKDQHLAPAAP